MAEEAEVRAAPQAAEPEINDKPSVDNPDEEMERHDEDMQQEDGNEEMEQEDDDNGSNSDSSSNQNKEDTADVQSNENKEGEHLSDYELARLERIKRNQARLASLGLTPGMNIPQVKKKKQQKKKKSMDLVPTRELPSRAGRAIFMESAKQEMRLKYREKEKEEESKNLDACYACQLEGGELMCCDYCRTLYHPTCHPISTTPEAADVEGFRCNQCEASGKKRRVACGFCDGCKRENDCETCVICVGNVGNKYRSKCIFRRCQSWGRGVLEKEPNQEGEEGDEASDHHESTCDLCGDGGDVICCDECPKVFHSNCHKPKIYSLPEGRWTCMYCTVKPTREKKTYYKPKHGDPLTADMGDKEISVKVNWPLLSCNVCAEKDTYGPKINQDWTTCRVCGDSYHLKCLDPPLEKRPGSWRCTTCKEKNKAPRENRLVEKTYPKPKNEKLFEGIHDDDCYICVNGGDLICCDYCSKVFHMKCHIPPLIAIPKGRWKCCECAAVEYKRMMRCGECEACLRDDCGKCTMCKDKIKFGGPGRLKQTCELKKCNYMRLAPPASRKSIEISDKDIEQQFKHVKTGITYPSIRSSGKRKEPSSGPLNESEPRMQKIKRLKKSSSIAMPPTMSQPPSKPIPSLDMVDTFLANDPVGSKIRTIISTAIQKVDNALVQKHACRYLRVFITNVESAITIIALGGLLMLAKAMYQHTGDECVQIEAITTLVKLAVKDKACAEDIVGSGCLALAIECVETHRGVLEVHQAVCALLRALSYDFRIHKLIMSCKGVEAAASLLKLNGNLVALLDGCYFLQNLLCNPHTSREACNLFLEQGLTSLIADGITAFPQVTYLRVACAILTNLAIKTVSRNGAEVDKRVVGKVLSILDCDVDIGTKKLALDTLLALSVGKDRFSSDFVNSGGIEKILTLMKAAPKDAHVSHCGVQLMIGSMKSQQQTEMFADADGFNVMTRQMSANPEVLFIQSFGCSILRRFNDCCIEGNKAGETLHSILAALGRFNDDEIIQFDGRHALLTVISQFPSVAPLLQTNKIREINSAYLAEEETDEDDEAQTSEAEVQSELADDVKDYTDDPDDPVCLKIKTIINKASKHLTDNKTQDKACEHLRKAVKEDPEKVIRALQLGAIEMIAEAMKAHPDKSVVQGEACATLSHFAFYYPKACKNIVDASHGCLPLVVQALKNHAHHPKVQQMGCGVFRTLSYDNENHYFVNGVRGFEVILDSMNNNSNKPNIMKEACIFLQNMLSNPSFPPEYIPLVLSKDVIPIIVDAMNGSKDVDFLEGACGTIKNLALKAGSRSAIGKYDVAIETIISVIVSDLDESVGKNALEALRHLASDNDIRGQIKQDENFEALLTFVTENTGDLDVAEAGMGLLMELAKDDAINQNVFQLVIGGMKHHTDSSSIQEAGCRILCNVSLKNDEEATVAVGVILGTAIKNHPDDNEVQTCGLCALLNICSEHPEVASLLKTKEYISILSKSELKGDK